MGRATIRTVGNPVLPSSRAKTKGRSGGQYIVPVGPKCFGCQGFSHMKQECPTYLKSIGKSKALAATLSEMMIPTMRMMES